MSCDFKVETDHRSGCEYVLKTYMSMNACTYELETNPGEEIGGFVPPPDEIPLPRELEDHELLALQCFDDDLYVLHRDRNVTGTMILSRFFMSRAIGSVGLGSIEMLLGEVVINSPWSPKPLVTTHSPLMMYMEKGVRSSLVLTLVDAGSGKYVFLCYSSDLAYRWKFENYIPNGFVGFSAKDRFLQNSVTVSSGGTQCPASKPELFSDTYKEELKTFTYSRGLL